VALALIVGIGLSWSRGAWLGLAISLLVVLGFRNRRAALLTTAGLLTLALTVALFGTGWLPEAVTARLNDLGNYISGPDPTRTEITDANFAVLERVAHWQAGLKMFDDHPWLGIGIGNYAVAYAAYALPHWYESLGHAHNVYLNFLAEAGVLGAGAFILFWLSAVWVAGRTVFRTDGQRALAIGVLGTLVYLSVHNLFDNLFVSHIQLQLALLLGGLAVQKDNTV
jgi:O-antigen ligase